MGKVDFIWKNPGTFIWRPVYCMGGLLSGGVQSGAGYGGQGCRKWESAGLLLPFLSINTAALHDDGHRLILARGVHAPPKPIPEELHFGMRSS
jgi:hypothetical protein